MYISDILVNYPTIGRASTALKIYGRNFQVEKWDIRTIPVKANFNHEIFFNFVEKSEKSHLFVNLRTEDQNVCYNL